MSTLEISTLPEKAIEISYNDIMSHPTMETLQRASMEIEKISNLSELDIILGLEVQELMEALKNICCEAIKVDSINFLKIMEDILWKKTFYLVVSVLKQNRDRCTSDCEIKAKALDFIDRGISFYQMLCQKAQEEYGSVSSAYGVNSKLRSTGSANRLSNFLVERFLLYIGDLYRYRLDLFSEDPDFDSSIFYYLHSFTVNPDSEYPLNQLGNLYLLKADLFSSTFFYFKGSFSRIKVNLSDTNLKLMFEKIRNKFTNDRSSFITSASSYFKYGSLIVIEYWLKNNGKDIPVKFFSDLRTAYEKMLVCNLNQESQDDADEVQDIIAKVFVMNFVCLEILRVSDSSVFHVALAYQCHLLFTLLSMVKNFIASLPAEILKSPVDNEILQSQVVNEESTSSKNKFYFDQLDHEQRDRENGDINKHSNTISPQNRKEKGPERRSKRFMSRRRRSPGSSCESEDELKIFSDRSESEESEHSENGSSSHSHSDEDSSSPVNYSHQVEESLESADNFNHQNSNEDRQTPVLQEKISKIEKSLSRCFLQSIKLIVDWIRCKNDMIDLIMDLNDGKNLIKELKSTIDTIPEWISSLCQTKCSKDYVFSEDYLVLGLCLFSKVHQNLAISSDVLGGQYISESRNLLKRDETLLRTLCLKSIASSARIFRNCENINSDYHQNYMYNQDRSKPGRFSYEKFAKKAGRGFYSKSNANTSSRFDETRSSGFKSSSNYRSQQKINNGRRHVTSFDEIPDCYESYLNEVDSDKSHSNDPCKTSFGERLALEKLKDDIAKLSVDVKCNKSKISKILIIDAGCICSRKDILERCLILGKFLLIFPLETLRQLDSMKKSNNRFRFAIKTIQNWHRTEEMARIQRESEYIPHFYSSVNVSQENQQFGRPSRDLSQILNVAMYFKSQTNNATPVYVLLSHSDYCNIFGSSRKGPETQVVSKEGINSRNYRSSKELCDAASSEGIFVENVDTFNRLHLTKAWME